MKLQKLTLGLLTVASVVALTTSGCLKNTRGGGGGDEVQASESFPTGYTTWKKVNATTVVRQEENIAREIYANAKPGLGAGTVLVKEQYVYKDGAKGALKLIAVMTRGSDTTKNKGWTFAAYDPTTKAAVPDTTSCLGCHSLQEDNDYLFTERSKF